MRRYTLRLPESLFQRLELMATNEGVSLNQFLVYSLTQTVSRAYQIIPVAPHIVAEERAEYETFIKSLDRSISDEAFDAIIASGEPAEPHERVDPEIKKKIEAKIAEKRAKKG